MEKLFTFLIFSFIISGITHAQESLQYLDIDLSAIQTRAQDARHSNASFSINLDIPNKGIVRFTAKENQVLSTEMKSSNPGLGTYDLIAESSEFSYIGKLTLGDDKLYAIIRTEEGLLNISPSLNQAGRYKSSYASTDPELTETSGHIHHAGCDHSEGELSQKVKAAATLLRSGSGFSRGDRIRTYRLVVVATGEFTANNGGTVASANTVITNTVNAMNIIYEKDMAITFSLTGTQIYTDAATDPFDPAGDGRTNQAAEAVSSNFAIANYDVGHVFHNSNSGGFGGGGVAGLGVVCRDTDWTLGDSDATFGAAKGAGWSGSFNNTSNGWIQLAAHEFGHMFGAAHTFNGTNTTAGNCTDNISSSNSYEIASGTTIMSYNGLCQADNNIPASGTDDNYFHTHSISQMNAYVTTGSGTCGTDGPVSNNIPVVDPRPCTASGVTIPLGTPFELTGSATDADGDALLYSWEQYDEDGAGTPTQGFIGATAGASTIAPLFRSYPPTSSPTRSFPSASDVANGSSSDFEVLPTVARTMTFALTVRDCNGGAVCASQTVTVDAAGPLVVNSCASALTAGGTTAITWNTNGSDALCGNVDVMLSIDGGLNFAYTLASGVSYSSGTSGTITIPAGVPNTTEARFKVVCTDNPCATFYNISQTDCTINSSCNAASTEIATTDAVTLPFGDAGLNLGLTNNFGSPVTGFSGDISSTDDAGILVFDNCGSCTTSGGNSTNYDLLEFTPDMSGSYTINRTGSGLLMNIYEPPFTASSCSGWLGSTATRPSCSGSVSLGSSVTLTLTAGTTYTIMISSFSATTPATLPASYTISFSSTPGGATIYDGAIPPTGFDYTYIAVDDATGNIMAASATSDFTALAAGCYTVYGVSYENTLTPSTWVGNTLSATLSSGDCLLPSNSTKPVKVTSTCTLSAGDLVITEIMFDPSVSESTNEWFEVYNPTGSNIDINGYIICDNSDSHTIGSSTIVPSMGYAVLAKSGTASPSVDYVYSTLALANTGDELSLKCPDGTLIDRVDYTSFGLGADGASIQLNPSLVGTGGAADNDLGSNWFTSTSSDPFAPNNDFGTPGTINNLPVELLSFNGIANGKTVDLSWITVSEINNDGFEVQRSRDSENWEKIGFVRGAGNSVDEVRYDFVDENPENGTNYYRLKQIDFDQTYSFTDVVKVTFGKKQISIHISPNPNGGIFQYAINGLADNAEFEITIFDSFGRLVSQQRNSEVQGNLNLNQLSDGIYIFSIQVGTDIYVERLMIH